MYVRNVVSFLVVAALVSLSLASGIENQKEHDVAVNTAVRKGVPVGVNFDVDVVEMTKFITSIVESAENRPAFVKTTRISAYHGAKESYNVLVFNMALRYKYRFSGVKYFRPFTYDGLIFGVWVFSSGYFHNRGAGGYKNWAFSGCYQRNRGYLLFRPYHSRGACTRRTVSSVKEPCFLKEGDRCSDSRDCCKKKTRKRTYKLTCKSKFLGKNRCRK